MKKIKDRITLGAMSGAVAFAVPQLSNYIQTKTGQNDTVYNKLISSLFLRESKVNTLTGSLTGFVANGINAGISGTIITYLLCATGKDKAMLKAAGVGATFWVAVNGVFKRAFNQSPSNKPLAPLLSLADHIIFSVICATVVVNLGDASLFPQHSEEDDRLPLVHLNSIEPGRIRATYRYNKMNGV